MLSEFACQLELAEPHANWYLVVFASYQVADGRFT
jgi:hypothetical protein